MVDCRKMADNENYGFLTRNGIILENKTNKKNGSKEQKNPNLLKKNQMHLSIENHQNQTALKKSKENTEKILKLKETPTKSPWWKSIFSGKQKKKNPAPLRKHESDDNLASHHFLKSHGISRKRSRKCKSEVFDENLQTQMENDFPEREVNCSSLRCQQYPDGKQSHDLRLNKDGDDDFSVRSERSNQTNTEPEKFSLRDNNSQENLKISTQLTMIDEESESTNRKPTSGRKTSKHKPTKPPRKYLSYKETKLPQTSVTDEVHHAKSKLRRSKSMLSLKNLFNKKNKNLKTTKAKTIVSESDLKKSASSDNFLNDLKDKLDVTTPESHSFNIYEKYPSRKNEQPKFLVHIQTREEIPIKDGVPQWDAQSYQYVTHRSKPHRPKSANPTSLCHSFLESSFIGRTREKSEVTNVLEPISHVSKSQITELILPLEQEIRNRTQQRQHVVEAMVHDDEKKQQTEVDNQNKEVFQSSKSSEKININDVDTAESFNSRPLSTSIIPESLLNKEDVDLVLKQDNSYYFGRSFVLTGVSDTQEKPDTIILKHPYLAESTPLRHMAKCLRQASRTDMPNKLSPVEADPIDFPPPPDSWTEISGFNAASDEENNSKITKRSLSRSPFEVFFTPSKKPISNFSLCTDARRSHSDSDLSSFHLTPMKLNKRYDQQDQNFEVNESRNSKTKHLLYRMHNRIERLKKLSDSSNSHNSHCQALPIANIGTSTFKKCSLFGNKKTETSLKLFKKLINKNLEKRKLLPEVSNKCPGEAIDTTTSCQQMNTESVYDYIWPQFENNTINQISALEANVSGLNLCIASCNGLVENSLLCNDTVKPKNSLSILTTETTNSCSSSFPKSSIPNIDLNKELNDSSRQSQQALDESCNPFSTQKNQLENCLFLSSTPTKANPTFVPTAKSITTSSYNKVLKCSDGCNEKSITEERFELDQDLCKDRIKSTILEEMKKISDKYRVVESTNSLGPEHCSTKPTFDTWNDLQYRWQEGFQETEPTDSDTASQSTLKQEDSDETSSCDTLTNHFAADDIDPNSLWLASTKNFNFKPPKQQSSYQPLANVDNRHSGRIRSCDENDARNFMNWDCDETDL